MLTNLCPDIGGFNRGYERLRAQNFEGKAKGDLKEGYYFGEDLPLNHPYVLAKKMNLGPNKYPDDVNDPQLFRDTIDKYYDALTDLAHNILSVIATTLSLEESFFNEFFKTPISTLRLLHYPPQEPDASAEERGMSSKCKRKWR